MAIHESPERAETDEETASLQRFDTAHERKESLLAQSSVPPPGAILTGKQEHYLKRELISQQTHYEIKELSSPTALQRFGAPFKSDAGEVNPADSELPLLRYIFVNHVRNFPFLDQAREKEFWQDKVQAFLQSFANKNISSSEDRLEETKRRKLALKAEKLVELMMVSGIPTASGYEEQIKFSEIEVVDREANDQGIIANMPEGRSINGWDVNVAGVRTTSVKRNVRYHQHAEFILRVKEKGKEPQFVGRRYGQFSKLLRDLRVENPGKAFPPIPKKNRQHTGAFLGGARDDDSSDSISSKSSRSPSIDMSGEGGFRSYLPVPHARHLRSKSTSSANSSSRRNSNDSERVERVVLYREAQRISLRAFLRALLQRDELAKSHAMREFLTADPFRPNREELNDIDKRKEMDQKRIEEQKKFYEIARKRAAELDVHMERFRRDIVESNGLTKLFNEIRVKNTIAELSPEYQKFAEWLRIEVAATIYHLFLSEDNSPELFAQAKRIHSLIPYTALKNVIRFANPAAVMKGVLDLFLAQPLGAKSLMQRIFVFAINDGIKTTQGYIDKIKHKIDDPVLCDKILKYIRSPEDLKTELRMEAEEEQVDIVVAVLRSEHISPELTPGQIGKIFNAYVAWNHAVENVDDEMRAGAELFAYLKQLLKLATRQRDKQQMLSIIEEPVTLQLFRDLFTIFYEPLVRVYKSANVYSSVTDFASFADDIVKVVETAQNQDMGEDPNATVQSFIDLCARHEDDFYKFIHEVHIHDNGLFDQLMGWIEGILEFLRKGPRSGAKLDMNAILQGAVDVGRIDKTRAIAEIDKLVEWQMARKEWHNQKTRRKMAAEGTGPGTSRAQSDVKQNGNASTTPGGFNSEDFGISSLDIQELGLSQEQHEDEAAEDLEEELAEEEEDSGKVDPITAERKRRQRAKRKKEARDALKSKRGEPAKPPVQELQNLMEPFQGMLRMVLAE